jgi:tRNA1(Val) A37 N6-methylase TrmN6
MEVTGGTLLGGRVRHAQPCHGHRTGIEPVLLAASIAARPGQRVLEGGSGAGAGLLCLAARVPDIVGLGVELDPDLAALARRNGADNGASGLLFEAGDIGTFRGDGAFDHAFANPPWHAEGTASPDAGREVAKRADPGLFKRWTGGLAGPLRARGSLTLVVSAGCVPECLAAFALAGCGSPAIFPLWSKPGRAAKLVLLRGIKGGRGPSRVLAGLTLHRDDGGYTAEAEAVLRDGAAIVI